jgi:hypothetical protein
MNFYFLKFNNHLSNMGIYANYMQTVKFFTDKKELQMNVTP